MKAKINVSPLTLIFIIIVTILGGSATIFGTIHSKQSAAKRLESYEFAPGKVIDVIEHKHTDSDHNTSYSYAITVAYHTPKGSHSITSESVFKDAPSIGDSIDIMYPPQQVTQGNS